MSGLIDTTEMYLKTVYELEEEGVPALRARIVERLEQSGPTVSETVARLERDGLLKVGTDRRIAFTNKGKELAQDVMRRHRLAERLLLDVLDVPLELVHDEACRWEHVISNEVADRIAAVIPDATIDPFGNPIPPASSTAEIAKDAVSLGLRSLADLGADFVPGTEVTVVRISETLQLDIEQVKLLKQVGLLPGEKIKVLEVLPDDVLVSVAGQELYVAPVAGSKIFVQI